MTAVQTILCTRCKRRYTAEGVCVPCQLGEPAPRMVGDGPSRQQWALRELERIKEDNRTKRRQRGDTPGAGRSAVGYAERRGKPHVAKLPPVLVSTRPDVPHNLDAAEGLEAPEGTTKRVLEVLCEFGMSSPDCWPAESTIAERIGVSRITVVRAKQWLREHGWISWELRWIKERKMRWMVCHYTINAGWCRPFRKPLLAWLDARREARSKANDALNELPRRSTERETTRSKGRRVRKPWLGPYEPWRKERHGAIRPQRTSELKDDVEPPPIFVSEDFVKRCGSRERAVAFSTWKPLRLAA